MSAAFFIFFGPPGSGKGTQAQKLSQKINLPVISTGDLLRQETKTASSLEKKAKQYMNKGGLVPDRLVKKILLKRLGRPDTSQGAIFDGYPRKLSQQKFLIKELSKIKNSKVYAVLVDVSDKEIEKRLGGRRVCGCGAVYHLIFNPPLKEGACNKCGGKLIVRDDDKPEVIEQRLKIYHLENQPLLKYWQEQNFFLKVDGERPIEIIAEDLGKKVKKLLNHI